VPTPAAGLQQFQIWVVAASGVPAARPTVDALRLSTLQNRLRCRVDKARRSVSGTRLVGRARRIHQGSCDAAQIWNCSQVCHRTLDMVQSVEPEETDAERQQR